VAKVAAKTPIKALCLWLLKVWDLSMIEPIGLLPWETAAYADLAWMPMAMRYKLDTIGFKVHLQQWQKLPFASRNELLVAPFSEVAAQKLFSELLQNLYYNHNTEPLTLLPIPLATIEVKLTPELREAVAKALASEGFSVSEPQWASLSPFLLYTFNKMQQSQKTHAIAKYGSWIFPT
jgi:hypothetical protein